MANNNSNVDESAAEGVDATPRRRRTGKRDAVLRAGRTVFARDGYSRSSIDAIAEAAGVSTRTIYNHFAGKDELFAAVLEGSATEVADGFLQRVEEGIAASDGTARGALVALGTAGAAHRHDFPEHFAMVRQIDADARHFPVAVLERWQEVGPRRVATETARRLAELADRGLLAVADADRAAVHLMALVMTTGSVHWRPPTQAEISATIEHGVDAFLSGYAPR